MQPEFEKEFADDIVPQKKSIRCPKCKTAIPSENIASEQTIAHCPNCPAVINMIDRTKFPLLHYPPQAMPKGMDLQLTEQGLALTRSWFSWDVILYIIFGLVFSIPLLAAITGRELGLLLIPHGWIGLGALYYALTKIVNRTTVQVTPEQISVKHQPLPFWFSKKIKTSEIKQLFVKEKEHRSKKSVSHTYELWAQQFGQKKSVRLIKGIEKSTEAFFIEQEMERFLGIKNRAVYDEFQSRWNTNYLSHWERFATQHQLNFVQGKILEGGRVWGVYRDTNLELLAFRQNQKLNNPITIRMVLGARRELNPKNTLSISELARAFDRHEKTFGEVWKITIDLEQLQIKGEQPKLILHNEALHKIADELHQWLLLTPEIIAMGSEVIPVLEKIATDAKHPIQWYASEIMKVIARTSRHIQGRKTELFCHLCVTRCVAHIAKVTPRKQIHYYGCRTCRQSKEFYTTSHVTAVLDRTMTNEPIQTPHTLRVNGLYQGDLFDFDAVEIIQASDEEVERFAVKVGNDTDPVRRPRYASMTCRVSAKADLTANTMRILGRTFGQVQQLSS